MEKKNDIVLFFWQITSAHTIAYFIAGIFALAFIDYEGWWATEVMATFYRPLDDPIVPLGSFMQIFRGIIIALIILPLRKVFFEEKHGLIKLGIIIFGFSVISTYAAAVSSFEGYIYLKVPYQEQITGYPEAIIWLFLFISILKIYMKYPHKKIVLPLSIIITSLICLMSIMGFIEYSGLYSFTGA